MFTRCHMSIHAWFAASVAHAFPQSTSLPSPNLPSLPTSSWPPRPLPATRTPPLVPRHPYPAADASDARYAVYTWQGRHCGAIESGAAALMAADLHKAKYAGRSTLVRLEPNTEPEHFVRLFKWVGDGWQWYWCGLGLGLGRGLGWAGGNRVANRRAASRLSWPRLTAAAGLSSTCPCHPRLATPRQPLPCCMPLPPGARSSCAAAPARPTLRPAARPPAPTCTRSRGTRWRWRTQVGVRGDAREAGGPDVDLGPGSGVQPYPNQPQHSSCNQVVDRPATLCHAPCPSLAAP